MKRIINLAIVCVAALVCASSASAQPIVVAGWDSWDDANAPSATVTATDVVASATASATRLLGDDPGTSTWTIADSAGDPGRGSSIDTTWGTFDGNGTPASAVTNVGPENMTATNAKVDAEVTFTITNNGANDLNLDTFHMDVFAFRFKAPRIYSLDVLAGSDISVGNVFASEGAPTNGNDTNDIFTNNGAEGLETHDLHEDLDIDMTGLADHTLASGETAIVQISFTGGEGDNAGGHHLFLDNVAFSSGTASSVVLGDVDLSGTVNFLDISPFIAVLSGGTFQAEADCDENGDVDFLDISPFIAILSGP